EGEYTSDHGGNILYLTIENGGKQTNLHSYWDDMLGFGEVKPDNNNENIQHPFSEINDQMIETIIAGINEPNENNNSPVIDGSIEQLPTLWATDTIAKA